MRKENAGWVLLALALAVEGALIAFPLLPRGWRLAAIVAIGAVLAVFAALRLLERHQQRGQEEAARAALARQKERWAREDPAG